MLSSLEIHPLSASALYILALAGLSAPYVYRFADGRWWLRSAGVEYWLFEDRLVENPF